MSHTDPITRIIENANRSDMAARVEATKRRVALTDAQRQLVLAAALSGDGSRLLEEVNHLRVLAYYDGRADGQTEGYGVGLEAGLTESRRLVADLANKFTDTGDATTGTLPLETYVIVKASRVGSGDGPYRGAACSLAGVEPGKVYTSKAEAEADAARLANFNMVGFVVQPNLPLAIIGPGGDFNREVKP